MLKELGYPMVYDSPFGTSARRHVGTSGWFGERFAVHTISRRSFPASTSGRFHLAPPNLTTKREETDIPTLLSADILALLLQHCYADRMLWNVERVKYTER
jgi:hypothetical protein